MVKTGRFLRNTCAFWIPNHLGMYKIFNIPRLQVFSIFHVGFIMIFLHANNRSAGSKLYSVIFYPYIHILYVQAVKALTRVH